MRYRGAKRRSFALGIGLVEVLVGLGLVAGAGVLIAKLFSAQSKGQRSAELRSGRSELARDFATRLSCSLSVSTNFPTPNALAAADGQLVNLYDRAGEVMVSADPANPKRVGDFTLRAVAHTVTPPLGFEIEVARPSLGQTNPLSSALPDTAFAVDPANPGVVHRWGTAYSRLFPPGAYPCAAQFVAGCVFACPAGSVVSGVDRDTHCVECANVSCPAGQYFRGLDANRNPICFAPSPPCAANEVRVGTTCTPQATLTTQLANSLRMSCRYVQEDTPKSTPTSVACANDEFLAGAGGRCVDAFGDTHFGNPPNPPGHNPAGVPERFLGYLHTNWPVATNQQQVDCYYNPDDPQQGMNVGYGVCCKLRLVYGP